MVNMDVPYRRSCYSLSTLQNEISRTFPGREQNKGFVTGYMAGARAGGISGHYADHRGVTYAYDIGVDIEGDGSGLLPRDAEWLFDYLETHQNARFQYAIYNNRITGNHTGWDMDPYIGSSPHKDHIHISVVDLQWGEPSGVSTAVTDSRASWGVYEAYHNIKPAAAKGPTLIQEDDMPSAKEVAEETWDVEVGLDKDKFQTGSYLLWTHNNTGRILDRLNAQNAQIEGLAGAVVALSKGEKLDIDKLLAGVEAAAKRGVESGIESVTRTETTTAKLK